MEKFGLRVVFEDVLVPAEPEKPPSTPPVLELEDFRVDYEETDRLLQLVLKKTGKGASESALGKRQEINVDDSRDSEEPRPDRPKPPKRKPPATARPAPAPQPQQQTALRQILPGPSKKPQQSYIREALKSLVLQDHLSQQDCAAKCEEPELELLTYLVKQRYTGTEYFKFPCKNKVITAENNKINFKLANERKCLPEVWRLVVEEVRKARNLSADPVRQTLELFHLFHRDKAEALRLKFAQQLRGLNKEEELHMLVCLFGEDCLDLPANRNTSRPMAIYWPLKTTDEYFAGILASPAFAAEVHKVLSGLALINSHLRTVDGLIERVLPGKAARRGIGADGQDVQGHLARLAECYPLITLNKLIEMLKKKLAKLLPS